MEIADWTTLALTAALVVITAYYAWQNRRMVKEMQSTRALSVLPKLALKWHAAGPVIAFPEVVNVGLGPALDVRAEVVFVPRDPESGTEERRPWEVNLLAPGESRQFLPMRTSDGGIADMDELEQLYERIELRGTASDALGKSHELRDSLDDIARWRTLQKSAGMRWQHPDAERRLAEALGKDFKKPVADTAAALAAIARTLRELDDRLSGDEH